MRYSWGTMLFSPRMLSLRIAPLVFMAVLWTTGCGPKIVDEPVVADEELRISLRRVIDDGQPRSFGYAHPATISDSRLAHILASLTYRDREGKRLPAIRSERVYGLAEAMNKAIVKATPSDEIVARIFEVDRRLGIFTNRKVTAFRSYFKEDTLQIEFYEIERDVEKTSGKASSETDYDVPLTPDAEPGFRMVAGESLFVSSPRGVQAAWREDYFSKPLTLGVRGGQMRRRTVLMESEDEEKKSGGATGPVDEKIVLPADTPPALRDAQLRALDELQAGRRSGIVREIEYQRRKRLILQGQLEEAGYPPPTEQPANP